MPIRNRSGSVTSAFAPAGVPPANGSSKVGVRTSSPARDIKDIHVYFFPEFFSLVAIDSSSLVIPVLLYRYNVIKVEVIKRTRLVIKLSNKSISVYISYIFPIFVDKIDHLTLSNFPMILFLTFFRIAASRHSHSHMLRRRLRWLYVMYLSKRKIHERDPCDSVT